MSALAALLSCLDVIEIQTWQGGVCTGNALTTISAIALCSADSRWAIGSAATTVTLNPLDLPSVLCKNTTLSKKTRRVSML